MDQTTNNNFWDQPQPTAPTQPQVSSQDDNTVIESISNQEELTLDNLTSDETIDLFIRGIMKEKGVTVGSEQMQNDIFADLKTRLLREIDRSLIAELPDDKLEELNNMATSEGQISPELVASMVNEANLNTIDIIGTTMARFRELYLDKSNINQSQGAE